MIAPIALTCGEPAGVGLELSVKAWQALRQEHPFFLIADRRHVASIAGGETCVEIADASECTAAFPDGLPFVHHQFEGEAKAALPDPRNAQGVIEVIARAVSLAQSGAASAICTNPINKKALKDGAAFAYPGHTEYLAALGKTEHAVMMLAAPELRAVPVTIHVPLSDVPNLLKPALLADTLRITAQALLQDFGIAKPRLAVAGLNPHAGEGGSMGHEELDMIIPLLDSLRAEGLDIVGPLPADTMFHPEARATYDVAVCMYHDQALIPLKTLNFSGGVNITLGLPFIRTSPDHGTAFDIAGKGIASPDSLIAALRQAHEMAEQRAQRS